MKDVIVIGSGFAGIASACYLAQAGKKVIVLEKNESVGGRASFFKAEGFSFDMGPSWYWMPDVFEKFFGDFGKKPSDYYELVRLDPGYKIFYGKNDEFEVPASSKELGQMFEQLEPGAAAQFDRFLEDAKYKYERGINDLVNKPSLSALEFADPKLLKDLFALDLLSSIEGIVAKYFKHPKIRKILEFPSYFLGATPNKIPALYSLMNFADLQLGTWYPIGGMHEIIKGMKAVAEELGVEFITDTEVNGMDVVEGIVAALQTNNGVFKAKSIVAAADYNFVEQNLLPQSYRQYDEAYWDKQVLAPSSLIFYLGFNKRIENLRHHNLFFDRDFAAFGEDIYENPKWPEEPLFYACVPSKTDDSVAPDGCENVFLLMPVAPDLDGNEEIYDRYLKMMLSRISDYTGVDLKEEDIIYKRAFAHQDFKDRYHAYKGNAYGLANTLMQTAIFKPKMMNKKIKNLVYAGQLTVPGPGVPPSLISGKLAAELSIKHCKI
ncbi:phytoene desaturase family protein [Chitinophagales bacterium]|nr:phytoene desaturase family protein [Chitinophagales bacterium]